MSEEAYPEAAAILAQAGWKPHDGWNVYTRDTLVMGFQPDGQAFHVKNWASILEGHPQWTPDTPDTAEEAAAWLVERFNFVVDYDQEVAAIDHDVDAAFGLAQLPEGVESQGDESNGETGEASVLENASGDGDGASPSDLDPADEVLGTELSELSGGGDEPLDADFTEGQGLADEGNGETGETSGAQEQIDARDDCLAEESASIAEFPVSETIPDPIDAEFTEGQDLGSELLDVESELLAPELAAPEPEDFAPDEIERSEPGGGAFIFGDNLEQLRTAAIGLVIRYANGLMPPWSADADAKLVSLRNFVMGVSEGRWSDDVSQRMELDVLETTIRRINEIKNARDTKVEFLEGASREEIVDFAVEANWP